MVSSLVVLHNDLCIGDGFLHPVGGGIHGRAWAEVEKAEYPCCLILSGVSVRIRIFLQWWSIC